MKKELSASIRTGIWIDQDMAYLIRIKGNKEPEIKVLKSGVESRVRIKGEGKVYSRFGKTFIDDQEKKQKRQQQQRKFFYKEIIGQLKNDDYLVFFGPGKTKEELEKAIKKDKSIKGTLLGTETTDRLTQNQMKKFVKDFFWTDFNKRREIFSDSVGEVV